MPMSLCTSLREEVAHSAWTMLCATEFQSNLKSPNLHSQFGEPNFVLRRLPHTMLWPRPQAARNNQSKGLGPNRYPPVIYCLFNDIGHNSLWRRHPRALKSDLTSPFSVLSDSPQHLSGAVSEARSINFSRHIRQQTGTSPTPPGTEGKNGPVNLRVN